ncbi:MAG: Trk system potassium transporter TrkA [Ruminococcaceae bacterium]|nr:Trk system potassium transporter TrkA [Oscillospiraceae bacterium]
MNIIIVGCGKVGRRLAQQLSYEKEHNITVIDINRNYVTETTNNYDVMGIVGSGTNIEMLEEAGTDKADILIAVTGSDEVNLLACLMAKKLGDCKTIARVRKPEYRKAIGLLKEDLGLAMIINPEYAAATEIARILRFPSAIQIDTFAKGRIEILKLKIPKDSPLDNLRIADISIKLNCDVLVCGVERGQEAFIPGGNFVLKSGDEISIIASIKNGIYFFKKAKVKANPVKESMIIGGGETAYYLADMLIKAGIDVKVFEKNPKRCDELCDLLPKATIVNGDGTENRLLLEEGLENISSFVSMTNLDEENVMLSLYAKSKTNGKIITKINRTEYDNVIGSLELGTIIYPKDITAEHIVKFVRATNNSIGSDIETMHRILDGKAEALEFMIKENSPVINKTLDSLNLKSNILIACISRGGKVIIPRGQDVIMPGDSVVVVTAHEGFKDISDILK